jgi:nucleoside-triphosphate--adenylate kinase
VLRTNIEKCTALGIEAENYIKRGKLVPDESMINVIMHEMKDIKGSFLLDGYPRTRVQAEKLDKVQPIDCVINLIVPYDIIIGDFLLLSFATAKKMINKFSFTERVKLRYIHMPSGRVYNLDFNPPKVPMKDDVTGEPLSKRPDDDPDTLIKRLQVYDSHTMPVLDFYKEKGILNEFKGNTSNEIWKQLKPFLDDKIDPKSEE